MARLSTGILRLDEYLGGGLFPGVMTVIVGTSGIGKTQLGLHYANAGLAQEGKRGVIYDMSARGDAQGHDAYAFRLFNWKVKPEPLVFPPDLSAIFSDDLEIGDYFAPLPYKGKRMTRGDLDFFAWNDWQAQLSRGLDATIRYAYAHFIRGVRRFVVDGLDPVERQADSIQFELLEYVYHQILRKESPWVARDLFRQHFLKHELDVANHPYDSNQIGTLVLYTSPETSLDAMIERPLDEGDLFAAANTIIYMGKIRDGVKFRRAMYVFKHRGSVCPDEIIPYEITEKGIIVS